MKRFSWMTDEDIRLLRSLPPEAAREMENLLYSQARSDRRFHSHVKLVDDEVLERIVGQRSGARYGTGGGRSKRVAEQSS